MPRRLLPLAVGVTALATALVAGPADATKAPASGCADVLIIAARGTGESSGVGGGLSGLVNAVTNGTSKTVAAYGVPYPASTDFDSSVPDGVAKLTKRAKKAVADCPKQRLVLAGYSQGAWVVGDSLASSSMNGAGRSVAAVVLYGDPRFNSAEPFDRGTFKAGLDGLYPRAKGGLGTYSSRIRSYCDTGDWVCQNGADGSAHTLYGSNKTSTSSKFVLAQLRSGAGAGGASSASTSGRSATGAKAKAAPSAGATPSATPTPSIPAPTALASPGAPVAAAAGTAALGAGWVTGREGAPTVYPPSAAPERKPWWDALAFWR